jgi:hypothetical protein
VRARWVIDCRSQISAATHHHAVKVNIFEGMFVTGTAEVTISRGRVVWSDGKLHTTPGAGRYIPRAPFAAAFDGLVESDAARDERQQKVEREPYTGPVCVPAK